jgi:hypothetical protein
MGAVFAILTSLVDGGCSRKETGVEVENGGRFYIGKPYMLFPKRILPSIKYYTQKYGKLMLVC